MPGPDFPPGTRPSQEDSLDFDASVAHPARVYDYWLGGTENFAADRAAASTAWRYREVATNHMVASNRPEELARLLLELA